MAGAGATAAAAAAVANAIKASGAIVEVTPEDFTSIVARADKPIVIVAKGGWLQPKQMYLTSYKGFVFYAHSDDYLLLDSDVELLTAKSIWIPG
jgi:ABC-type transport system substrate-binding protein